MKWDIGSKYLRTTELLIYRSRNGGTGRLRQVGLIDKTM